MTKHVRVRYFAVLREERGRDEDEIDTGAHTAGELYEALKAEYGFTLPRHLVGVALNSRMATRDTVLNDGDEVVFLPPVAGG